MHTLLLSVLGAFVPKAHAALEDWGSANEGVGQMWGMIRGTLYTQDDPVASFVGATIIFVYPLIGAVATIIILAAGIRVIASQGKEDAIASAKNMIIYALAGVFFAVISSTVIAYFADTFFPCVLGASGC